MRATGTHQRTAVPFMLRSTAGKKASIALAATLALAVVFGLYVNNAVADDPNPVITSFGYTHLIDDEYLFEGTVTGIDPMFEWEVELGGVLNGEPALTYIDGTFEAFVVIPQGTRGDATAVASQDGVSSEMKIIPFGY